MLTSKWKYSFLDKPVDERMNAAMAMRQKSEIVKKSSKVEIMDVNQQHLEKVMRDHGVLKMIHGHTHRPAVHEFNIDNTPARRYVLGAWYTRKSVLYYDNGCFALRN